jgi:uncharacterized protein YecE (DUF72 family)
MNTLNHVKLGVCNWKYDSWQGLVYSQNETKNSLREYSKQASTLEIDQWFLPIFKRNIIVWPRADVMKEYAESVPPEFIFTIKVPYNITLTHQYSKQKDSQPVPNPYFLSLDLMLRFLESIRSIYGHIGPLMFQFEYLDEIKMPSLNRFIEVFEAFVEGLPSVFQYCVEIKNPNYLRNEYFDFLARHRFGHVFLQGRNMPTIFDIYEEFKDKLISPVIIKFHGDNRKMSEDPASDSWNEITEQEDEELIRLDEMVHDLLERNHDIFINVNSLHKSSIPRKIEKINTLLHTTLSM